jgi:hypothetical protein
MTKKKYISIKWICPFSVLKLLNLLINLINLLKNIFLYLEFNKIPFLFFNKIKKLK